MFNVNDIRKDFPMLKDDKVIYLDNGATTFKPQCVIDAVTSYYTDFTANAHRGDYGLALKVDQQFEATREKVANFIGCQPKEVVFTSGASSSLNQIAYGIGEKFINKGDVIVISEAEHASNVLPWFRLAETKGAEIRYVPLDQEGRITVENMKSVLDEKVKVVSLAHVHNVLGYLVPIKQICKLAHEVGALMVVDGAQSVPHVKIDVKDLDVDFLAFSSHKMCGPTGIGVMYGKYDLLQTIDPYGLGGGSNARFDMCGNLKLKDAPYKFEAGTQPIEAVIGLGAAIDYLSNVGMEKISEYEKQLHDYAIEKMSKLDNIHIYNPNGDTGIIAFNVNKVFAQDAASYLATKNICVRSGNHCAKILVEFLKTSATLRCALYFYNTKEEIDAFVEALKTTTIENCISTIF